MIMVPKTYNLEKPWTRQPCDDDVKWSAFLEFRNADAPRTLASLGKRLKLSQPTLRKWASDCAWRERVFAYDRHIDAIRCRAVEDALSESSRDVANRHAAVLRDAQVAAASVVKGWLERLADGDRLEGWTPNDVRGMLKDLIQLERLVRGEATERVEHGVAFDLSRLSVDEIETMRVIEAKATTH